MADRLQGKRPCPRRERARHYHRPKGAHDAHGTDDRHAPRCPGQVNHALIDAIDSAYDCAQACTSCADACLAEAMVQDLRQCIRFNMDCADVCAATASIANRRTGSNEEVIRRMLEACIVACRLCGDECERHAGQHEHCRVCADSCRMCEAACDRAMKSMQ